MPWFESLQQFITKYGKSASFVAKHITRYALPGGEVVAEVFERLIAACRENVNEAEARAGSQATEKQLLEIGLVLSECRGSLAELCDKIAAMEGRLDATITQLIQQVRNTQQAVDESFRRLHDTIREDGAKTRGTIKEDGAKTREDISKSIDMIQRLTEAVLNLASRSEMQVDDREPAQPPDMVIEPGPANVGNGRKRARRAYLIGAQSHGLSVQWLVKINDSRGKSIYVYDLLAGDWGKEADRDTPDIAKRIAQYDEHGTPITYDSKIPLDDAKAWIAHAQREAKRLERRIEKQRANSMQTPDDDWECIRGEDEQKTGAIIRRFRTAKQHFDGHTGGVDAVAVGNPWRGHEWAKDDLFVFSASKSDNTVRCWSRKTNTEECHIEEIEKLDEVVFSPHIGEVFCVGHDFFGLLGSNARGKEKQFSVKTLRHAFVKHIPGGISFRLKDNKRLAYTDFMGNWHESDTVTLAVSPDGGFLAKSLVADCDGAFAICTQIFPGVFERSFYVREAIDTLGGSSSDLSGDIYRLAISSKAHHGLLCCLFDDRDAHYGSQYDKDQTPFLPGDIYLWNLQEGRFVLRLRGHEGLVTSLICCREKHWACSAGDDGTIRVWDLDQGKELYRLDFPNKKAVTCLALSSDNKMIVAGGSDGSIRLWEDFQGGIRGSRWRGHEGSVGGIAFSHCGRFIVSGGAEDNTVRLWELTEPVEMALP